MVPPGQQVHSSSSVVDIIGPSTEQHGEWSIDGIDAVTSYVPVDAMMMMSGRGDDGDGIEDMSQPSPSPSPLCPSATGVQEHSAVTAAGKEHHQYVAAVGADQRKLDDESIVSTVKRKHDESMLSVVNLSMLSVVQTDDLVDLERERESWRGGVATTDPPPPRKGGIYGDSIGKEEEEEGRSVDKPGPTFGFSDCESSSDDDDGGGGGDDCRVQQLAIGSLPKHTYFRGSGLNSNSHTTSNHHHHHRMQNKAIADQMKQVESVISPSRKAAAAAAASGGNHHHHHHHLGGKGQQLQMEMDGHSSNSNSNSPAARSELVSRTASSSPQHHQQLSISSSSNQWKSAKGSSSPDAFASAALYSPSGNHHHKMTFSFSEHHHSIDDAEAEQLNDDDDDAAEAEAEADSVLDIVEEASSKPSIEAAYLKQQQQQQQRKTLRPAVSPLASAAAATSSSSPSPLSLVGRPTRHEAMVYSTTSSTDEDEDDAREVPGIDDDSDSDDDDGDNDDDDDSTGSSCDEVSSNVSSRVRRTTNTRVFSQQKAQDFRSPHPSSSSSSLAAVDLHRHHHKNHDATKRAPTVDAESTRSSSRQPKKKTADSRAVDERTESNSRGLHPAPQSSSSPLGGVASFIPSSQPHSKSSTQALIPKALSVSMSVYDAPVGSSDLSSVVTLQPPLQGPISSPSLHDDDDGSASSSAVGSSSHGSTHRRLQARDDVVIAGPSDETADHHDPGRLSMEQSSSSSSHYEAGGGGGTLFNANRSSASTRALIVDSSNTVITALQERVNILDAQAKLSAESEVKLKLSMKEREEYWLAEIAALKIALDRVGADKQQQDRVLCELRLASTTQAAVIDSLEAGKKTLAIEASMCQRKADRQALSTVLSQQKLISALETSLTETQQQVRRLEQELSELSAMHLHTVSALNHLRARTRTMDVGSNNYSPMEDLTASSSASSSAVAAVHSEGSLHMLQRQLLLVEDDDDDDDDAGGLQALALLPSTCSQESKDGYNRSGAPATLPPPSSPVTVAVMAADRTIDAFRSVAKHNIQQ